MSKAIFLTESYIKDKTPFYNNIDVKDFKPSIITAQDIYIQRLLGYQLYKEIEDAVISDTVSADQAELLALIRPCLAWYAYYMSLPFILVKSTNKSLVTKNSDNSTAISFEDMKYLKEEAKNIAENYAEAVKDYLINPMNYNKFPSYTTPDNYNVLPDKGNQFFSGIYLNDKNIMRTYGDDGCCDENNIN